MAYVRKTKSAAELSAARSAAAKSRKKCSGGRPVGSTKDPLAKEAVTGLQVTQADRNILSRYAFKKNTTLKGAFHLLMLQIEPQLKDL